jgi:hypothetical protein
VQDIYYIIFVDDYTRSFVLVSFPLNSALVARFTVVTLAGKKEKMRFFDPGSDSTVAREG